MHHFFWLRVSTVLLAVLLAGASHAATKTWKAAFASGSWSIGSNWEGNVAPAAGDTVVFNRVVDSFSDLGGVPIARIVFGPNAGGSVVGGALTIDASLVFPNIDDQSTGAANLINASINMTGDSEFFIRSGEVGHLLELRGLISGGRAVAGAKALAIVGSGTVKLNRDSNNTYTGVTTVASASGLGGNGLLQLAGNAFAVIPGALIVGTSTTASTAANRPQVQWLISQVLADTTRVTVGPDGLLVLNASSETIAQLSGTGTVTMGNTTLTVGDAGTFTWGGVISGPGNVNKVGTGAMTYTAGNTYTGTTTVSGGTLQLNAPVATGAIKGPLTIGLGVGTVESAAVTLDNNFQTNSSTVPITINSDGTLDTIFSTDTVGAITMNGGRVVMPIGSELSVFGGLNMSGGTISGSGLLVLVSDVVATATAALGVATINTNVRLAASDRTFTVNSGSAQPELTIGGSIATNGGPRNLIKTGTGTLRLAGSTANTYGGSTTIERGVLELDKPSGVPAITGPIVIGNGADSAVLRRLRNSQIGGKPPVQINASGTFDLNGGFDTIGGLSGVGSVLLPNLSTLQIDSASGTSTFDGVISSPNATSSFATNIIKEGAGRQVFNGNNSYTKDTKLVAGELVINGQQSGRFVIDGPGTLSGTGRFGTATLRQGSLRPGAAGLGGTLSTGEVAFQGSALAIDLISPTVFGKLNATGTVALSSDTLSLLPAPGFAAPAGTVFEIVTNDGTDAVVGTFAGLPQGATVSAGSTNFTISYAGGTGNDITLTVAKTTPVMTLSANPNPVYPNATATLSLAVATVGGVVPTGSVAFAINGTAVPNCSAQPLFAGVVSCFVLPSSLTAGTASVTASYSGDGNYAAGSPTPLSLVVADVTTPVLLVQVNGPSFGVVTSNPTGISCAGDCSEIYSTGTVVTLTATPNAGSVFVGWGGGCIGRISPCTLTVNSPKFATARFAPISIVGTTINIDIDGDGKYRPETDGLLITRWIRERSGPALTEGAVALPSKGGTATRVSDVDIQNYLTNIFTALDVNLSGGVTNTDSVLILRYLFGFRGAALVAGVTLPSGVTAAMVEANLLALTPVIP